MAYTVGILPAAGKAERFGGVLKEELPYRGASFLEHAYNRLPCDDVVVVTNKEKIQSHANILGDKAIYLIQHGGQDMWSAMVTGMHIDADTYFMTMPDTYLPKESMFGLPKCAFQMGLFETTRPARFGCFHNGMIINKSSAVPAPARAWGVLVWTKIVKEFWFSMPIHDYTDAINKAIVKFGSRAFALDYYHDLASIDDYTDLLIKGA